MSAADEALRFEAWVATLPATMQAGVTSSTLARMVWQARASLPNVPPSSIAPPSDALRAAAIKSLSDCAAAYRDYFHELHWLQSSLEKQERISAIAHGATAKLEEAVALLAAPSAAEKPK